MDLTCLFLLLESVSILTSIKIISHVEYNKYLLYIYVLMHTLYINLLYFKPVFAFIFFIVINTLFMYFISKNNKITNIILYFVFYYGFAFVLSSLSEGIIFKNSLLLIYSKEAILIALLIPIFGILMIISSLIVDKSFHLYNYKTKMYITLDNKERLYSCYFDTGNTLKYKDIPVIFLRNDNIEINKNIFNKEIEIKTLNGEEKVYISEALIRKKDDDENYFVYVGLSNSSSFEGCEVLLNAYLF